MRRADLLAVGAAALLLLAAALVGRRLLADGAHLLLPFPPLLAQWLPHVGPGTPSAVVVAALVATRGPAWAERLPWRAVPITAWVAAAAWTLSLALVDGWQRGVVERLTSADEYLHDVPRAPALAVLVREFGAHIVTTAVDPGQTWFWTTHVGAHPPGAFLIFVVLDRVGLGGGGPAGMVVIAVGASAAAAVVVAARALGGEAVARRAAPYAVLFPGAVWVGVSADGLFAGVLAWAGALLALGATTGGRRADLAALAGGLLLGATAYLSYGLVLGGLLAAAALACGRRWRPAAFAGAGAALVGLGFTLAGFSWLDGYADVRLIYAASIAAARPYPYFVWANLAAAVCAVGPAGVAGLRRIARRPAGPYLVVAAAVAAMLVADLSGMSKAEVERIWLPYTVWTSLACAELPHPRRWLAGQAGTALLLNHLLLTTW